MILYLCCRRNHTYMLTKYAPIRERLIGFEIEDYYAMPGDPIAHSGMCALMTPFLAHDPAAIRMRPLDPPILVNVEINPIEACDHEAA